ncbi:MAG: hypothetical protein JWO43_572 [Candidatus Adlerbacteria bacterium]|nr:hypothetical protein [Candidatus Adlerbacteria bacterium]
MATSTSFKRISTKRYWLQVGLALLVCGLAHWVSIHFFPSYGFIDLALPFAVCILFFAELRLWFLVAVVVAASEAVAGVLLPQLFIDSMLLAGQAVLGAKLLSFWAVDPIYRHKSDALYTIAMAAIVSCVGLIVHTLVHMGSATQLGLLAAYQVYSGALLSLLVGVPFLLRWWAKPRFARAASEFIESVSVLILVFLIGSAAFIEQIQTINGVSVAYLLIFPFFWIALRLRPRFVTLALVITTWLVVGGMYIEHTPIAEFLRLEWLMSMAAVVFLIVAAQEEDRRTSRNLLLSQMSNLQNALARLSGESKAREDFIAVLAHEIRNPLAPVVSTIELLKLKGARDEEEAEALDVMSSRMDSVKRLLEDLLDVSRIIEGKVAIEKTLLNLPEVVNTAVQSIEHSRLERHQKIHVQGTDTPLWVSADRVRMEQVFSNLLSNASKYSSAGDTIYVRVWSENNRAFVEVRDTGVGLAPETFEDIFTPFRQVYTGPRKIEGLGIGLAVVKHFVELHDGSIRAHSDGLNKGSTFTVSLPLSKESGKVDGQEGRDTPVMYPRSKPGAGKLILVADDNDAAAGALGRLLEIMTYRVAYAYDGNSARKLALDLRPDVAILDVNMPGMNGREVAIALREKKFAGKIVALSGYGEKDINNLYGDSTVFDSYLVKPVGVEELRKILPQP